MIRPGHDPVRDRIPPTGTFRLPVTGAAGPEARGMADRALPRGRASAIHRVRRQLGVARTTASGANR